MSMSNKEAPPRCGDHVYHAPTRENWVVAYAEGDDIAWCGWPDGRARLRDCTVTKRCSDEEHADFVRRFVGVTDDTRPSRVLRLYGAALNAGIVDNEGGAVSSIAGVVIGRAE